MPDYPVLLNNLLQGHATGNLTRHFDYVMTRDGPEDDITHIATAKWRAKTKGGAKAAAAQVVYEEFSRNGVPGATRATQTRQCGRSCLGTHAQLTTLKLLAERLRDTEFIGRGEEMDIDDDDNNHQDNQPPLAILIVTSSILAALFHQYRGVHSASTKLNAAGEEVKTAEVVLRMRSSPRQMLDGFQLKRGWNMTVPYLP
ncbi:hypothetical protein BJV77DRAFT_1134798 [Russula vinacea]|nr:hypothetical protein BJV77DRAFT_1134798 [Russula vinacea]